MTNDRSCFETFEEVIDHPGVCTASQEVMPVKGQGTVRIKSFANDRSWTGNIYEVLYVPDLRKNLFSLTKCTKAGYKIIMEENDILIQNPNEQTIITGVIEDGLPRLLIKVIRSDQAYISEVISTVDSREAWPCKSRHNQEDG